jgi:hypothetical protein
MVASEFRQTGNLPCRSLSLPFRHSKAEDA